MKEKYQNNISAKDNGNNINNLIKNDINNNNNNLNNNDNNINEKNEFNNQTYNNYGKKETTNIGLLKVKDIENILNPFKNEEKKIYENYTGESFILKKNWDEICYVYNNYNMFEINYEILALDLKKDGYFPSCNLQCFYDFEIIECTINGQKGEYKKIGTLLQINIKLYNLQSTKIHVKYKELKTLSSIGMEKKLLYKKDYYGLREALVGQIAKYTLIHVIFFL